MPSLFAQFRELIPADATVIGTVTAANADGTGTVDLIESGGRVAVIGLGAFGVGDRVIIQGIKVIGEAPSLTITPIVI